MSNLKAADILIIQKMIEKKIKRTLERCDEQIKNKQGAKNG